MATEQTIPAPSTRLVPLADVIARASDDQEPAPGFVAKLRGENVEVTAVLRRTAVVASLRDRWADKQVMRLTDLLVDPAVITWRPKAVLAWRRRRNTAGQREGNALPVTAGPEPIRHAGPRRRLPRGRWPRSNEPLRLPGRMGQGGAAPTDTRREPAPAHGFRGRAASAGDHEAPAPGEPPRLRAAPRPGADR